MPRLLYRSACVLMFSVLLFIATVFATATRGTARVDDPEVPASFYKLRREKLMKEMGPGTAAIFYSAPVRNRNGDTDYPYRQGDDFYYLTGLNSPNLILAIIPSGFRNAGENDTSKARGAKEILFYRPHEAWEITLEGPGLTEAEITTRYGFERVLPMPEFQAVLRSLTGQIETLYVPTFPNDFSGEIATSIFPLREMLPRINQRIVIKDPTPLISALRTVKSADEIALIRKAAEITVAAQTQVMMSIESGMHAYEISALLGYIFARLGAEAEAFPSIVASGSDALILHSGETRKQLNDGELVLVDAGAEYHNYSADVTRTMPVGGRFTDPQREVYEIVLQAEDEAIRSIKPGVKISEIEKKACEIVTRGLVQIGVLKGSVDSLVACGASKRYMVHGIIHCVGLAVHDEQPRSYQCEVGMVFAIEPGIYLHADSTEAGTRYGSMGVRIEDTIVVTRDGSENLSADLPRSVQDIERLMKRRGLGNEPID